MDITPWNIRFTNNKHRSISTLSFLSWSFSLRFYLSSLWRVTPNQNFTFFLFFNPITNFAFVFWGWLIKGSEKSDLFAYIDVKNFDPCCCTYCFGELCSRGLGAVRDLKRGEIILRVPKSALMTSESVIMEDKKLCLGVNRHSSLSSVQVFLLNLYFSGVFVLLMFFLGSCNCVCFIVNTLFDP